MIVQVFSFRVFHKRVFKMAPIHHHFVMEAWSETKIMLRFWIVAAACGAVGFTLYQVSAPTLKKTDRAGCAHRAQPGVDQASGAAQRAGTEASSPRRRSNPGCSQRPAPARATRRVAPPLEHRILMTATLCLIAFGAVMVYSASSPQGVINGGGYGTSEFLMYLFAAGIGLVAMRLCERYGLSC